MSATHVAFLRAINTGGRRLTNDRMLEPFVELGFADVGAYQAAGNISFRTDEPEAASDGDRIEHALYAAYGFETPVFVRTLAELRGVIGRSPFTDDQLAATEGRVQVTFLRSAPDPARVAAVSELVPSEDLVVVDGREWFWLPRAGIGASRLPLAAVETELGPMTTRTLGTLRRMVDKLG